MPEIEKHKYSFSVQLNWQGDHKGILTALDVSDCIHVATPPAFAGDAGYVWSPEHLFLGALNSCFMTTFLAIAEKRRLAFSRFECNTTGEVELAEGHLVFTKIDVFPKVVVKNEEQKTLAAEVLLKAGKHCIVANSIKTEVNHHGEVLIEKQHITL